MTDKREHVEITNPLVIVNQTPEGKVQTSLYPPFDYTHQHFALLACDLIRHVAAMYGVPEDKVWYWVDKERRSPSTKINSHSAPFSTAKN